MKVKVFCIHGMGVHSKDWFTKKDGPLSKIKKLRRYEKSDVPGNTKGTLDDFCQHLKFIDIYYDDLTQKLYDAAGPQHNEVSGFLQILSGRNIGYSQSDVSSAQGLINNLRILRNNNLDGNIWDVLLCSMRLTRHFLAVSVAEQILEHLDKNKGCHWAVIAHSLGSAVANEALNIVYKTTNANRGAYNQARTVLYLSNFCATALKAKPGHGVNHILLSDNPVDTSASAVWPSSGQKQGEDYSICQSLIVCRHKLDPLAQLSTDIPHDWHGASRQFKRENLHVLGHSKLYHLPRGIKDSLVDMGSFLHSAEHYMASPEVYLRFFSYALGKKGYRDIRKISAANSKFIAQTREDLQGDIANRALGALPSNLGGWIASFLKVWMGESV